MDVSGLIDGIMRHTTVLIAQLATAAGVRAPLAHVADEVFFQLARELEEQGVRRKVAADMFGLALRSYQKKMRRLEAGIGSDGTLWEALRRHVAAHGQVSRATLLHTFHRDDPTLVAALLADLVEQGLLTVKGNGDDAIYQHVARPSAEHPSGGKLLGLQVWQALDATPMTRAELLALFAHHGDAAHTLLDDMLNAGQLVIDAQGKLRASLFTVAVGDTKGWEAAVLDHFSALARAVAAKVSGPRSADADRIGGATLGFDLHPDHPYRAEVEGLLAETRGRIDALFERVSTHNAAHPYTGDERIKVTFYFGQHTERA